MDIYEENFKELEIIHEVPDNIEANIEIE